MVYASRERVHYNDSKLLVYSEMHTSSASNGYEHAFVYFENKTNNTIRVKYKITVMFMRYQKKHSHVETIYISPQSIETVYPASYEPNMAGNTAIVMQEFELINYAEKKENKEVDW